VLRELGLAARLGAVDVGDVVPKTQYRDLERPPGGVRNAPGVAAFNREVGARIADLVQRGYFPLVLGGDCSILLGALQGLHARRGDVAVAYLDAHADFASLEESPSGSACSMNLALALGRNPEGAVVTDPVVDAKDVVHIGRRDEDDSSYGSGALKRSGVLDLPAREVRALGLDLVAEAALERLTAAPGGYWIHFDVDVLDPSIMPAVDSPLADGFTAEELTQVLAPLVAHPRALGLQVTIYDPTQDPGRTAAHQLVDLLVTATS